MSKTPAKPSVLEEHICPLTGDSCQAGHPAKCDHFWQCVRDAVDRRGSQRDGADDAGGGAEGGRAETG